MDKNMKKEPIDRFKDIMSATDDEDKNSKPELETPLDKLPRGTESTQAYKVQDEETPQNAPEPASPETETAGYKYQWGPAFWTITGILSLSVNVVLIVVLLVLLNMLGVVRGTAGGIGNYLLGGLYDNFDKLDRATIVTTIPVDAQIPLNISVPVQTTTQITLAQPVVIPDATVQINTGGVAINSQARVTLPAQTPLTVNLNFDLPVQTTIPVHLDVPIKIPMTETELHEPFVGLQDVVRPFYCFVDPKATNLDGQMVCNQVDTP